MTLAALIFDVDGTLAETEETHRRAFNRAFAEAGFGWEWSVAQYTELLKTTGGKERINAFLREIGTPNALDAEAIAALHRRKTDIYTDMIAAGEIALRPGIVELVAHAHHSGLRVAVATTTNLPNVEALCQACWKQSADDVFDAVAAGDAVAAKKPAPDVYLLALDLLGLAPDQCLAFEDSRNGLRSAKAANLRVIATPSLYSAGDDLSEADGILSDLHGFDLDAWWSGRRM
ncbi:MAG: HAD-IA family hydrolase [Pseudomonadota bacterium]